MQAACLLEVSYQCGACRLSIPSACLSELRLEWQQAHTALHELVCKAAGLWPVSRLAHSGQHKRGSA